MSKTPERTHDNLPRRLIIGGEPHGPIEIYNDDREFLGRGRIAQAPPPGGTAFVRADVADEEKRQRDVLLARAKRAVELMDVAEWEGCRRVLEPS